MAYRFTDMCLAAILELAGIIVIVVEDEYGEVEYTAEIPDGDLPGYLAMASMAYMQGGDA